MKILYTTITALIFLTASFSLVSFDPETNSIEKIEETTENIASANPEEAKSEAELITEKYELFVSKNETMPTLPAFSNAMIGFSKLAETNKIEKQLLTIVDFNLPSTDKRMWILDLNTNKVLYNTYVSHGRNTGGLMAENFSNIPESFQSSLGFYITGETYHGGNGYSLRIDGMEKGINDNARKRAIVIHGAEYATENFMKKIGRLGRSYGCPAIPTELTNEVIDLIKGKSVLFLYQDNANYMENTKLI